MFKNQVRAPILALFLISVGGLLLHIRIHPPSESAFNLIPVAAGSVSVLLLPLLFNYRRTVGWAYILNAAIVIIGTVGMAYHSIEHWAGPVTIEAVLLKSTLADILILLAKLPLGHHILRHFRPKTPAETHREASDA